MNKPLSRNVSFAALRFGTNIFSPYQHMGAEEAAVGVVAQAVGAGRVARIENLRCIDI